MSVDRKQLFAGAVGAAVSAVYAGLRVAEFTGVPGRVTDTPTYEAAARIPLWDWHFYAAERGLTIPLFYKLVHGAQARVDVQLGLSILAWLLLAAVVARSLRGAVARALGVAVVLGTSMTWEVIRWDSILLSESITLSLTALVLAAAIALVRAPSTASAIGFSAAAFFWVFARDTNAYVLLVVAAVAAVALVRPSQRRLKTVVAVACVAIFAADYASADVGRRWLQPMRDIVAHRVLPDPEMRAFFVERGLEPETNWPVGRWMVDDSRRVYARWLISHPKYTFVRPVYGYEDTLWSSPYNLDALISPHLEIYDSAADRRLLSPPQIVEKTFFPHDRRVVALLLLAALALAAVALRLRVWPLAALVPLSVLVTTYPHLLVVWLQSGLEVDRHAVEAAILLRLASFLVAVYALDALAERAPILRSRRSTSARSTRSVDAAAS